MGIILTMPDQMTLVSESSVEMGRAPFSCCALSGRGLARAGRRDSLLAEIAADPDPLVICFVVRQAGCLRWSTADRSTPVANDQEPMIQISRRLKNND